MDPRGRNGAAAAAAAIALAAAACGGDDDHAHDHPPDAHGLQEVTCDVAIVGGGAGGLHTAFRLAPSLGDGVCLFEKEAALGGRILDVPRDPGDPASPVWGAGALRVQQTQDVLFALADELGLTLETPPLEADLIAARGRFGFDGEDFVGYYPGLTDPFKDMATEDWLYDELLFGTPRLRAPGYPDFRSYLRAELGLQAFEFLRDMSRFRADFDYPLDPVSYLDYLTEEWDVCCTPSYPVGGMSRFIAGMEDRARADGARIFTSDPVARIERAPGNTFRLVTAEHLVTAQRVVIAVPPAGLAWIGGDVADGIKAQRQLQDLIGVKVATITQWWPSRWWAEIVNPLEADRNHVWRAWTAHHCINYVEIPLSPYGVAQDVTRTVYADDRDCVDFWEAISRDGTDAVEAEIRRGLTHLFVGNGRTEPVTVEIPAPLRTHVQIWPAGWHWLRAGTSFTNADIFTWALEPLPGEQVALVGEAYHPNRSGWSDAAYKSSINLLNVKYGLDLPGLEPASRPAPRRAPASLRRH